MIRVCLAALTGHWRRQPMQLLALVLGLAVATALWSGVQAVNSEAKASYDRAASLLGGDSLDLIERTDGTPLRDADFVALRRAGWNVSPILDGRLRLGERRYRLIGIDPLTLPNDAAEGPGLSGAQDLTAFMTPPFQILASAETIAKLPKVGIPPLKPAALPPDVLLSDIGVAKQLLQQGDHLSRITVAGVQKPSRTALADVDPALIQRKASSQSDLGSLTESFHLNLTAFGLMAFVVGLFIVHATIGLAFEQRRSLMRTLRALGVPLRTLIAALLFELILISGLSGLIGVSFGYLIAASLLPDVAASLSGLYGASVPGELSLSPNWWLGGMAMGIAGALVAAAGSFWKVATMPILDSAKAQAWLAAVRVRIRVQSALAMVFFVTGASVLVFGSGLLSGFVVMGATLLGAALILPTILSIFVQFMSDRAKGPIGQWFWADTQMQLNGLSLALMALLLALSINIGVGAMVGGFRTTFLQWLDQRLAAQLYVYSSSDAEAEAITQSLNSNTDVIRVLPIWGEDISHQGWPVTIYGILDDPLYRDNWPMIDVTADAWDRVAAGTAILISEQLARKFEIVPGDEVEFGQLGLMKVVGVYADYGNPTGAALVNMAPFLRAFPGVEKRRLGVRTNLEAADDVAAAISAEFGLRPDQVVNQQQLKAFSRGVFEKTFAVTAALNTLTLAVAGLALLTSLLTLAQIRLPQLAPAWAMGLTRARLGWIELARSLLLALITAVLAIPLGVVFAWILTSVINVEAFGWKLPLYHFPGQWLQLTGLAMLTAAISSLWPVLKLQRVPPAQLLRLFSNER